MTDKIILNLSVTHGNTDKNESQNFVTIAHWELAERIFEIIQRSEHGRHVNHATRRGIALDIVYGLIEL